MPLIPFEGFCDGLYLEASPVLDAQRSINLFPVPGYRSSKSKMALYGRPGLSQTGFALTLAQSPARALWAGNNRLFAAGGTHFYELASGGSVLTDYGAMAGSGGQGQCQISANGTQLLVMDSSAAQIYNANTTGPAMNSVFNGVALEYLDGFYVAIATGASLAGTNPNQVNVSNLGDGTTWNALNYIIRTGSADLTTALAVLNGQLWIFGQKAIEVWYNAGNPNFPFARYQGGTINLGLMAPASVVKFSNTVMWLAANDSGYAQVYMANGMQPVRVSTFAVEYLLGLLGGSTLQSMWAYGYQENGHTFYVLQAIDGSKVPLQTFVYDLTTQLWHERSYGGAWPVSFASVPGFNSNGPNFVGDGKSGKVMFQGMGYANDLGTAVGYTRTAPHISNSDKWTRYSSLQMDADIGTAQPVLSYSNNGGKTFSTPRAAIAGSSEQGTASDAPTLQRFKWWQLGRSRDRVFRIQITDSANLVRIVGAFLNADVGNA